MRITIMQLLFISLAFSLGACDGCGSTEPEFECETAADCADTESCIDQMCISSAASDAGMIVDAGSPPVDAGNNPEVDAGGNPPEDAGDTTPVDPNDIDGDGIPNSEDTDDDGDGLSDADEVEFGTDCSTSDPMDPDTDNDGIIDSEDPYPYDPWPEIMVRQTESGRIELFLSNRDGTFEDAVLIGEQIYGDQDGDGEENLLEYRDFAVGDFDKNGKIDFLARTSQFNVAGERQVWFFTRDIKRDEFEQRLIGRTGGGSWGIQIDANEDTVFDLVVLETVRPEAGNITTVNLQVYINNRMPEANCFAEESEDTNCFFRRLPDMSLSDIAANQWVFRFAKQAVNLNPDADDHLDISVATYASGGASDTPTYTLFGNGDGTFQEPVLRFTHDGDLGPANSMLFADFNNDDIGDVVTGFDDDGTDKGSGWFYQGTANGTLNDMAVKAVDLNPTDAQESGGGAPIEHLGRSSSGKTFDFDFDGNYDLVIGYEHEIYGEQGQTRLYFGNGDGTFDQDFVQIGENSYHAHRFNVPQKLCPTYEVNSAQPVDGGSMPVP
jgi:hypothetical protein